MIRTTICLAAALACQTAAAQGPLQVPPGLRPPSIPDDNPLTEAKVELGKKLYFDKRLSSDNTVSCASCHDPAKGWSNGERFATGVDGQQGGRSAPTIVNAAYYRLQFWDGRAELLEGQALGPIENPIEMNLPLDKMVERLSQIEGYKPLFKDAFGDEKVTQERVAKAIASFERTVLAGDAPYDRFKAGDESALSEAAQRGRKLFFGKANCSACHAGPNFSDGGFHNVGVGIDDEEPDVGRHSVSSLEGDRGSFKTPSLRDIARTAPYMHDGRFATLEEVVDYYDKGGTANPQLDEEIFKLDLTEQEKADLVAFLKEGLTSEVYPEVEPPELPE